MEKEKRITKEKVKGLIVRSKFKIGAVVSAPVAAAALAIPASAESASTEFNVPIIADSVTGSMMNGILDQLTALLPVVLPVAVGCIAFRKGLSWFLGMIRGL